MRINNIKFLALVIIMIIVVGCALVGGGGPDYSSPSQALLGRWMMADGSGEVSFTEDGDYHFVDPFGTPGRAEYLVLEEDGERRTISTLVRLKEFEGEPVEEEAELVIEGRFSPNYRVFVGALIDEEGIPTGEFRMRR